MLEISKKSLVRTSVALTLEQDNKLAEIADKYRLNKSCLMRLFVNHCTSKELGNIILEHKER